MKHFKEGRNHIFEFGEMSITRMKLKPSQYDELVDYFAQQQVKNLNTPAVSGNEVALTFEQRQCPSCKLNI